MKREIKGQVENFILSSHDHRRVLLWREQAKGHECWVKVSFTSLSTRHARHGKCACRWQIASARHTFMQTTQCYVMYWNSQRVVGGICDKFMQRIPWDVLHCYLTKPWSKMKQVSSLMTRHSQVLKEEGRKQGEKMTTKTSFVIMTKFKFKLNPKRHA